MTPSETNLNPVKIEAKADENRPFVLYPDDNDAFVRTGKQVIQACQLGISIDLWMNEFHSMLEHAAAWAADRGTKIRSIMVATRSTRVVLFVVPRSERFNFDLADELVQLNADVMKQFNIGMVEMHQVPWEELDRFVSLEHARPVYGEKPQPHPAVEA